MIMGKLSKRSLLLLILIASFVWLWDVSSSWAAGIVFDRGLPIYNNNLPPPSNLNGTSNANRSNFSISFQYSATQPTTYQIPGDDFTIGRAGQTYLITNIRVWMIYGKASSQYDTTPLSTPSVPLVLWLGPEGGSIQSLAATPAMTRIWYSDGSNYQRASDGTWRVVWQIDFHVNLKIKGGQKYQFFLHGLFKNSLGIWQTPSLCDVIEDLSNNPHRDGADNQYLSLTMVNGSPSGAPSLSSGLDANVQIFGNITSAAPGVDLLLLEE
jgi:hypothetical protein